MKRLTKLDIKRVEYVCYNVLLDLEDEEVDTIYSCLEVLRCCRKYLNKEELTYEELGCLNSYYYDVVSVL